MCLLSHIVIICTGRLIGLTTATADSKSQTIKDVPVDYWAYEIRFLTDKQVIKGFSNNNFKPLTTLTCKDATIMIVRALKLMLITHPTTKSVDLKSSMGDYTEMIIAANIEVFTIIIGFRLQTGSLSRCLSTTK